MSESNSSTAGAGAAAATLLKDYDLTIDYYGMLGIESTADPAAIRKAYREQSRILHPDKNPDNPRAADQFQELKKAYDMLCNEPLREAYDSILRQQRLQQERFQELGAQKRKMRQDLEDRERLAAETKRPRMDARLSNRAAEVERVRYAHAKVLREYAETLQHKHALGAALSDHNAVAAVPARHRSLVLKWDQDTLVTPLSARMLQTHLERAYGAVNNIAMQQAPPLPGYAHASPTKVEATVEFTRLSSALNAMRGYRQHPILHMIPSVTWATGSPPPQIYIALAESEAGNGSRSGNGAREQLGQAAAREHERMQGQSGGTVTVDMTVLGREDEVLRRMERWG
ncbi:hypothetical protein BC828DRAFT_374961 [Blastocladiella britannica]|nr:hypothetical protein BC828DRAFT_374961 [Blastocladiella britannica]